LKAYRNEEDYDIVADTRIGSMRNLGVDLIKSSTQNPIKGGHACYARISFSF
jgi:hypothetical protein